LQKRGRIKTLPLLRLSNRGKVLLAFTWSYLRRLSSPSALRPRTDRPPSGHHSVLLADLMALALLGPALAVEEEVVVPPSCCTPQRSE